ncbi:MAG TPA: tRNA uridine-5-carboxymethylaminomethyl(34) synthesis GTPase MnmE [Bacteroidia bacterium]|nr:tRNA uridine-5-carboxymethylaminomethyl(34) synthesis GTPase MnmE [Bacteroidia bacterium]HRH08907.1 tRNA uridine-5-carboxymethylaminomethyl(34) synthesis GTPase MnmE [Bacteroidia bacterium]
MLHELNDTIVAPASAPGIGAIALIRISGKEALSICSAIFYSPSGKQNLATKKSHTAHFGSIRDGSLLIDEVVATLFLGPRSFTGETTVELSCHGSPYIQQQIISLLLKKGARMARAGEFTMRAFLNGKLDLSQAEAVADVIAADTEGAHKLALQQMRGGFSSDIRSMRQQLIDFAALMELELDFSEEDVEFANREQFVQLVKSIQLKLLPLIDSFKLGNVIKNGVPVAIAGKPNAGKSTLLNTLLNEERALVSEIAGTTRDSIEEVLNVNGVAYRFIDTAGLRETEDSIEKMGVEKSYEKIKNAGILLYVVDATEIHTSQDLTEVIAQASAFQLPYLVLANKSDLCTPGMINQFTLTKNVLSISAKQKDGIVDIKNALGKLLFDDDIARHSEIVTNMRHYDGLKKSFAALDDVLKGVQQGLTTELIALDLRRALAYMGELSGEISNEQVLDSIFSRFCIGK